jgi:hypothetical protein
MNPPCFPPYPQPTAPRTFKQHTEYISNYPLCRVATFVPHQQKATRFSYTKDEKEKSARGTTQNTTVVISIISSHLPLIHFTNVARPPTQNILQKKKRKSRGGKPHFPLNRNAKYQFCAAQTSRYARSIALHYGVVKNNKRNR